MMNLSIFLSDIDKDNPYSFKCWVHKYVAQNMDHVIYMHSEN